MRQLGDLGVLRGAKIGVAEEARIRGFAAPAFAGCAFVAEVFEGLALAYGRVRTSSRGPGRKAAQVKTKRPPPVVAMTRFMTTKSRS